MGFHVFPTAADAAQACAVRAAELLRERLDAAPWATLVVSGGTTPALMFEALAAEDVDWKRVYLFQVDERLVPPNDPGSNYRLAREKLIIPAGIPPANVHRIRGELPGSEAADRYGEEIREFFGLGAGEMPAFDVVHRGMGEEAHTASLFPGEPLIANTTRIAAAVHTPKPPPDRITLLPGPLNAARHTLMLLAGEDKAEALRLVMREPIDPFRYPAQIGTRDCPTAEWFVDQAAAARV